MKRLKRFSAIAAAALALIFCAGCGFFSPPTTTPELPDLPSTGGEDSPGGGGTGTDPSGGDENAPFTVNLVLDTGGPFIVTTPVTAQWKGVDGDSFTAPFNEIGVATCSGLDGEYQVTISPVPAGYTYDCNGYTADNFHKSITIELLTILSPTSGFNIYVNASMGTARGLTFEDLGTYRATIEKDGVGVWYMYQPTYSGELSIQSWVDVSADEINPKVEVYYGSFAYINPYIAYSADGGSTSGNYTKNFKLTFKVSGDEVGNVFIFRIFAETVGKYPLNIDFTIKREGSYERPGSTYDPVVAVGPFDTTNDLLSVNLDKTKLPAVSGTWRYAYQDTANILRVTDDNGNPLYGLWEQKDGGDGYWHMIADPSAPVTDPKRYGTVLRARICEASTVLDGGFMDQRVSLRLIVGDKGKDYTDFIGRNMTSQDPWDLRAISVPGGAFYSNHCDRNGTHPLTEELRIFLQEYATQMGLFNDGEGTAEGLGLNASEETMWLFVVGYYSE